MSTPIVICDESSDAREQLQNALPSDWDVNITHACNGREGIEAIKAGKADLIFLDLTMPDMNGLEILEIIKNEDLPTIVIVTYDDAQLDSQQRAQELGAIALIKKPVIFDTLSKILNEYGVLGVLDHAAPMLDEHDEDLFDFCQEIVNIAMGRAAALLAKVIAGKCVLSVPKVTMITPTELKAVLYSENNDSDVSIVSQGFIGGGIAGEALLTFRKDELALLAPLLKVEDELTESTKKRLLMDITSILLGSFLTGIADLLDISFSQNHPKIVITSQHDEKVNQWNHEHHQNILAIEFDYSFDEGNIECSQLVLFTESSVAKLSEFAEIALD